MVSNGLAEADIIGMNISFEGQNILVIGAARGIGRAIASSFAEDGASVFAADILQDELEPLKESVVGGRITTLKIDVTSEESVFHAVEKAAGQDKRIDVVVYVAGGVVGRRQQPIDEVTTEDFDAVVDVNLRGAFFTIRAVLPLMKERHFGRIIVIASPAGLTTSLTGIQSYAASKHAQIGLVKQVAREVGQHGVTVNAVAPGFMATSPDYERQWNGYTEEFRQNFAKNIAVRRMGRPHDIADAVLFLASDRASFITGQILPVTGSPLL